MCEKQIRNMQSEASEVGSNVFVHKTCLKNEEQRSKRRALSPIPTLHENILMDPKVQIGYMRTKTHYGIAEGCKEDTKMRVPKQVMLDVLTKHGISIPNEARICQKHLVNGSLKEDVDLHIFDNRTQMTGQHINYAM